MPEQKITLTKEEMTKAFLLWNKDAVKSPEDFIQDVSPEKDFAQKQTDTLFEYLERVKK